MKTYCETCEQEEEHYYYLDEHDGEELISCVECGRIMWLS